MGWKRNVYNNNNNNNNNEKGKERGIKLKKYFFVQPVLVAHHPQS